MADVWNEEVVSGGSVDWNSVPEEPSRGIQGDLQTTWEENWDDGPAEQTDDWDEGTEEEEEEEEDDLDDGWNDQDTADAAWSDDGVFTTNPTTSSRLTKLASNFRGLVKRSVPKLARSKAHSKDNERAPAPEVWGYVSPEEIEAERVLAAHASKEAASEPLNFTDPLLSFSDVEGEDFLSRFLSKTRLIAIHPERKHKLAMFMLRLCQEACYEHVKMHAPRALTLLQINAADDIEFQYWFDIIDSLRWKEKIPKGRVLKGENPGYNDGLKMLRHTAEHRLDYDSKLIKYVVWHLEKLDDEPRRSELGSALEQVYRNECEVAARKEAQIKAVVEEDLDTDQPGTTPSTKFSKSSAISPGASSATLVGSSSDNSSRTAVDDILAITTAPEYPTSIPAIETPTAITSHNHFLRACQNTLEHCLFNHLCHSNPDYPATRKYITSSQIELNVYDTLHSCGDLKFKDANYSRVRDFIYGARKLRNAAAHHTSPAEPECLRDESLRLRESTARFFQDALELVALASDSNAARAIRLAAWVADINLGKAALELKEVEDRRSRDEREALYKEAEHWKKGLLGRDWWLEERLTASKHHFWGELHDMRQWDGVRTILSRWERGEEIDLTDPRMESSIQAWYDLTDLPVESSTESW